ncbi:hypothetical protein B0H13DRAFT_1882347 [Mycena leptocephala]|nr:hypothetical protein B0H13DRAFT_1882347 [Mycena leptocephala]
MVAVVCIPKTTPSGAGIPVPACAVFGSMDDDASRMEDKRGGTERGKCETPRDVCHLTAWTARDEVGVRSPAPPRPPHLHSATLICTQKTMGSHSRMAPSSVSPDALRMAVARTWGVARESGSRCFGLDGADAAQTYPSANGEPRACMGFKRGCSPKLEKGAAYITEEVVGERKGVGMDDRVHGEEKEGGCKSGGDAKQEQKMRKVKTVDDGKERGLGSPNDIEAFRQPGTSDFASSGSGLSVTPPSEPDAKASNETKPESARIAGRRSGQSSMRHSARPSKNSLIMRRKNDTPASKETICPVRMRMEMACSTNARGNLIKFFRVRTTRGIETGLYSVAKHARNFVRSS